MSIPFKVGDMVKFSRQHLRGIGMFAGPIAHARGTITKLFPFDKKRPGYAIAYIDWQNDPGGEVPTKVITPNLHLVGKPELD